MKTKIILTVGISGAGKSTWCQSQMKLGTFMVGRDTIRRMLFGDLRNYYEEYSNDKEKIVTQIQEQTIRTLLHNKAEIIIVDNTWTHHQHISDFCSMFGTYADIELKFFDLDIYEAKKRVELRDNKNFKDLDYMHRQVNQYVKTKEKYFDNPFFPMQEMRVDQPDANPAIVCDIDGTLALFGDRNPFDRDFRFDTPNIPVLDVIKTQIDQGIMVIFISGRSAKFREDTQLWLEKECRLNPKDFELHMRREGDARKDTIVKMEIFSEYIQNKWYVNFVIDDRLSVVRQWERLGLFVFNVNQELKEF